MDMTFSMPDLTQEDVSKLHEFARAQRVSLADVVQAQFLAWLKSMEQKFSDSGPCPSCALRGVDSTLKGLPILQAETEGLIKIGDKTDRGLLGNTLYVICPRCLWWGVPERQ